MPVVDASLSVFDESVVGYHAAILDVLTRRFLALSD